MQPVFALGVMLARRGVVPVIALVVTGLTVLGMIGVAITIAMRGPTSPLHDVPIVASSALAWGGGFLLAFGAAPRAFVRDRDEGIRHLLVFRTTALRGYLVARVGGLALLIAVVVAGGTFLVGAIGLLTARDGAVVLRTLQATLAGVAYAIAFAFVISPISFAAFGTRSRFWGYLNVLSILLVPELLAQIFSKVLPPAVTEVFTIPSALAALRAALSAPGAVDPLRFLRALVSVFVFSAIAFAVVRRNVIRLETAEPDP